MPNLQSEADGPPKSPRKTSATTNAHIIVFGNEKGGSGKSTSAMHTAIALLRLGYKVATIDLDARQATLTRYMSNRFSFITKTKDPLPSPTHLPIERSQAPTTEEQNKEDENFFTMALVELLQTHDFIVVDTPGSDTFLSRLAHSYANTLITPMNDSFIDLDLLATLDPDTLEILKPSVYTMMVQEQKFKKIDRTGEGFDWIIMRNRLSHINAKNKQDVGAALDKIAKNFELKIAPGFGERVIFRELFLNGLTLMDLQEDPNNTLSMSQIAARQEVRNLIQILAPESIKPQNS